MASNSGTIATAYVQVMPSMQGVKAELSKGFGGSADSVGKEAGTRLVGALKKVLIAAGIGAFVGKIIKGSLSEGAKLQQSYLGGIDTLYGNAADAVRKYADAAAKAGISANDYAEQAVSFGASLKKAFGGDVTKAAEAANAAIMDMADNSAKMGTDITSVQMAYQGFAKQNYTMLDNLKIGYGGTKEEMQRLLKDAQKLTGVKYNIDNLGDVYAAIHAIQGDLGLTGVAAQEASTTFSGSFEAMKASAANLFGAMALGQNVEPAMQQLIESAKTFIGGNLIPMLSTIGTSVAVALKEAMPAIMQWLRELPGYLQDIIPDMIRGGGDIINAIVSGITGKESDIGTKISEALIDALKAVKEFAKMIGDAWNSLSPQMQDFILKMGFVLLAVKPLLPIGKILFSSIKLIGGGIAGLVGKLFSLGSAAPAISGTGGALASLAQNAVGLVAVGAGILLASAGFYLLSQAAIQIAAAGAPAAIAMGLMVGAIAGLAIGAAILAPALAAGAVGLVAFGAGIMLVGVGAFLASAGLMLISMALPGIVAYGAAGAGSILMMSGAILVFSASAFVAAAASIMLGAGLLIAGVGAITAGVGFMILGVGAAIAGAGLAIVGAMSMLAGAGLMLVGPMSMLAGAGLMMLGAGAIVAGAGMLLLLAGAIAGGAALLVFGAGVVVAGAGSLVLAAGLLLVGSQMSSIAKNASTAAKSLVDMVTSIDVVKEGLSTLKDKAGSAIKGFLSIFKSASPSLTSAAQTMMTGFTTSIIMGTTAASTALTGAMSGMASAAKSGCNNISNAFGSLQNDISNKMNAAVRSVKSGVSDMERAFSNAKFSMKRNIELPHFKMSGKFDAQTNSVPSISVSWYKSGGILTKPTLFGAMGGKLLGGGEAGHEAVLPIDLLKDYMRDVLAEDADHSSEGNVVNLYIDGIKYNTDDYIDSSINNFVTDMIRKGRMYGGK